MSWTFCVSCTSVGVTKSPRKSTSRGRGLFGLMALDHGHLILMRLGLRQGRAPWWGGVSVVESGKDEGPYTLQRHIPSVLLPPAPFPKALTRTSNWGPSRQHANLRETFHFQKITHSQRKQIQMERGQKGHPLEIESKLWLVPKEREGKMRDTEGEESCSGMSEMFRAVWAHFWSLLLSVLCLENQALCNFRGNVIT